MDDIDMERILDAYAHIDVGGLPARMHQEYVDILEAHGLNGPDAQKRKVEIMAIPGSTEFYQEATRRAMLEVEIREMGPPDSTDYRFN